MQDRARWIRFQVEIERTTYPVYSRPFFSQRRVYESLFAGTVALIDEISTKRIHIEEKIKGREATTGNTSAVRRLFKYAQTQK